MLTIGNRTFKNQLEAKTFVRGLLTKYEPKKVITADTPNLFKFLTALANRIPDREKKIGPGVLKFM